jgi:endonuclease/exonuclease/phosphatase family metal-dependent hydrolase
MRRTWIAALGLLVLAACNDREPTAPTGGADLRHAASPADRPLTVLTRNLYLGADIGIILGAPDPAAAAAEAFAMLQYTQYPVRAGALAAEILATRPDLVGLQEVTRYTTGPFPVAGHPQDLLIDFLDVLQLHLAARGLQYDVVVRQVNARIAFPLPLAPGHVISIGYEDSDAILVRRGIPYRNAQGHNFVARPPLEVTSGIPFVRGWTQVDARIDGRWVTFVNTHLEIQPFRPWQHLQTRELLAHLERAPFPVVLVGDFNSAANPAANAGDRTDSYAMFLAAGFRDLWTEAGNDPDDGLTCCEYPDLSNPVSDHDQRLDIIFVRDRNTGRRFGEIDLVRVLGADPDDRVQTPEGYFLWPSDHAGVVARVLFR